MELHRQARWEGYEKRVLFLGLGNAHTRACTHTHVCTHAHTHTQRTAHASDAMLIMLSVGAHDAISGPAVLDSVLSRSLESAVLVLGAWLWLHRSQ